MNIEAQIKALLEQMKALLDGAGEAGLDEAKAAEFAKMETEVKGLQATLNATKALNQLSGQFSPTPKRTQLPLNGGGERKADEVNAPNIAQFSNLWKYDGMAAGDLAMGVELLEAVRRKGQGRGAGEDMRRALAVRLTSDETKGREWTAGKIALKTALGGIELKANELNQSTLADYGDEWVGVVYSGDLWPRIVQETPIAAMIPTIEIPQGAESVVIPLEGTPPTFYKVAQATAQGANPGPTTQTVTTSKMGTDNSTLTVGKLGAATTWTGELTEDSVVNFAAELRASIQQEAAEVLEHLLIDGDTAAGATTNINDIGGTPAGTEAFMVLNGFRKLALVTNTANSRDGGVLTVEDYLETLKLMGLGGQNAIRRDRVMFILDLFTAWKSLELAEIKTRDVFSSPTIENGVLKSIWGVNVYASANMHRANQNATYGLRANAAGKVDLDTASNNTKGAILAVRADQWRMGWKRRITIEVERDARADAYEITALMRVGLNYRDTEAAAISYNLTV